ncbi:hypothetical protein Patl1_28196 [Pistacia atlantica]|uniref:Uncharacterized protein n=1 Tax=Pistacia atlantica TaxID=434234 RepID=A0ACC1BDN9_9ROSI|nr:hypothetical protein Patl1_28196 [Pistacia atlantica]
MKSDIGPTRFGLCPWVVVVENAYLGLIEPQVIFDPHNKLTFVLLLYILKSKLHVIYNDHLACFFLFFFFFLVLKIIIFYLFIKCE